jgi:hypothetical protein
LGKAKRVFRSWKWSRPIFHDFMQRMFGPIRPDVTVVIMCAGANIHFGINRC